MELTVRENLVIYGRYFDLSRARGRTARRRAARVRPADRPRRIDQVEPLSGGMKRRLTIARSLINEPSLLLLDEPTTGLDPQARHLLWDRLYRLKQRGVTLVLTTHYMDEAEQLCDRLVVMDKAKIVGRGLAPRAHRAVLDPRGPRAALPGRRRWTRSTDGSTGSADRVERLPDRVLLYADDGEAVGRRRSTSAVSAPRRASSGGRPSRTSSSGSPAEA